MKKIIAMFLVGLVSWINSESLFSEEAPKPLPTPSEAIDESLKREAIAGIQRAVNFLTDNQKPDGSWCNHPAITALVCMAIENSHSKENSEIRKSAVEKGREYILKFVQPDGSIWMAGKEKEYPNYTTAVSLAFLALHNDPNDETVMRNARKYLLGSQVNDPKNPFHGGIGYGSAGEGRPDLSNTQWALEALYLTEHLDKEPFLNNPEDAKKADLAWKNAVMFLSKLQNLPESNDSVWVLKSKDEAEKGGFIYKPDESKASDKIGDKESLRTYGSMTYAGLKSMIYAKLDKNDPRVRAAVEWGKKHYTLDENPGMGSEGHFYYIQTFSKAYSLLGEDMIKTDDGQEKAWRVDLVKKLLSLQKGKGEWVNEKSGRWMECIPELVTAYALLSLEAAMGTMLN